MKPKENCQTTAQVIAQVEGEFRAQGYGVTLSKNTINRYVALGMLGTFQPLVRGYKGMMPKHAFELLVRMTDDEFEKYIDNSIIPLYPDLKDTPGKCVLLGVDSGPGRNGRELLVKCHFRGLYIYHGLPNATSMQQETDLNYGPFKSVICNNLREKSPAFYGYPSTHQRLGSLFMAVPSQWAPR